MFCATQATWTNPDQVSVQKKFIGNDKISEIVNDSDFDGGNFSELSDNTYEVKSPFSSNCKENMQGPS
jgi:hypothetical protein